jgi:DNA-binding NtrC family response regulator
MGKTIETILRATMQALQRYVWPGNVRELRNVLERAMILNHGFIRIRHDNVSKKAISCVRSSSSVPPMPLMRGRSVAYSKTGFCIDGATGPCPPARECHRRSVSDGNSCKA